MSWTIKEGKLAMGFEVAIFDGYLIQRTGAASILGAPLMCDIGNTTYDQDADEGGIFGNAITPITTSATFTHDYLIAPMACTTQGGVATANRVQVRFQGLVQARVNAGAAVARARLDISTGNTYATTALGADTLAGRSYGLMIGAHGGTGTESVIAMWAGAAKMT